MSDSKDSYLSSKTVSPSLRHSSEKSEESIINHAAIDHFFSHFKIGDGCWEWDGYNNDGYGLFTWGDRLLVAHRMTYTMVNGPIADGLVVDHLCRNHACVNPDHLEAISHRENVLRGISPVAENAKKTRCKRGHEFDLIVNGRRGCNTCRNILAAAYRERHREKINKRELERYHRNADRCRSLSRARSAKYRAKQKCQST